MKVPADFGFVSAKYESGGRGVGTVSTGQDDPGGVSYGKHQLASRTGTMAAFVRSPEGQPFADRLHAEPGSDEFTESYLEICEDDADAFEAAQLAFIIRTHFTPVYIHAKKLGFMVDNRGVQEALYSISVQHGGAIKIVNQAKRIMQVGASAEDQIGVLYRARAGYVTDLHMANTTKRSLLKRYRNEINDALAAVVITEVLAA